MAEKRLKQKERRTLKMVLDIQAVIITNDYLKKLKLKQIC